MAKKRRRKTPDEIKQDVITKSLCADNGSKKSEEGGNEDKEGAGVRTLEGILREGYPK